MDNKKRDDGKQKTDERQAPQRDSHGTKIDPAPGPGPKDAGKGAMGEEAKDRLNRNTDTSTRGRSAVASQAFPDSHRGKRR